MGNSAVSSTEMCFTSTTSGNQPGGQTNLSPIRRAVRLAFRAALARSAPLLETAHADAAHPLESSVRGVSARVLTDSVRIGAANGTEAPLAGLELATYGLKVRRSIL
jgi:hypothetical protein